MQSPEIERLEWGRVHVAGHGAMKDAKLWLGGAREWGWDETGTRHVPGIQPADVDDLLHGGAERVILSRGQWRRLRTRRATLERLERAGVAVEVLPTPKAVARYNEAARAGEAVGALIHSTC